MTLKRLAMLVAALLLLTGAASLADAQTPTPTVLPTATPYPSGSCFGPELWDLGDGVPANSPYKLDTGVRRIQITQVGNELTATVWYRLVRRGTDSDNHRVSTNWCQAQLSDAEVRAGLTGVTLQNLATFMADSAKANEGVE